MSYNINEEGTWLTGARVVSSPNCDTRPLDTEIDLLIIHGISLPPKEYGGGYIDKLFTNTLPPDEHPYFMKIKELHVSSHLLIDRQGSVTQYVPFDMRAWHAGESTFDGRNNCNDYSIGIELEGCDEEAYKNDQYLVLAEITNLLCQRWQKIKKDRIVGHSDVSRGRKTDPGPFFDMGYYFSLLKL